jgi:hypothetical protein
MLNRQTPHGAQRVSALGRTISAAAKRRLSNGRNRSPGTAVRPLDISDSRYHSCCPSKAPSVMDVLCAGGCVLVLSVRLRSVASEVAVCTSCCAACLPASTWVMRPSEVDPLLSGGGRACKRKGCEMDPWRDSTEAFSLLPELHVAAASLPPRISSVGMSSG